MNLATGTETIADVVVDARCTFPDDRLADELRWCAAGDFGGYTLRDLLLIRIRGQRSMPGHRGFAVATGLAWRAYRAARTGS